MTKLAEIYDNFLSKISDYNFLSPTITSAEIDEELFGYFKTARTKFYKCKNSLDIVVDTTTQEQVFTVELHSFEIEVITTLMLVEYLKPQVMSGEVLKQSLSDKDFKIYSQASQLRELNQLYKGMKSEANKMITEYTYFELGKPTQ